MIARGPCRLFALVLSAGPAFAHPPSSSPNDAVARIEWCRERLKLDDRNYAILAQLGEAQFDKARATSNPKLLTEARASLVRSLEIQPNLGGQKAMVAIGNYSHRFSDALEWVERALETDPQDTSLIAMQMEALIALGRMDQAEKLLASNPHWKGDFHLACAWAQYLKAAKKLEEAADAYQQASRLASAQNAGELQSWAVLQTARIWIEAGHIERASQALEAAEALGAAHPDVTLVRAEMLAGDGKHAHALELYEKVLEDTDDPQIHAFAFESAVAEGDQTAARRHFVAAESGFQRVIDAGEVYTLGALARLYLTAKIKLDRALELCEENLKYQRDTASKDLCAIIQTGLNTSQRN